MNEHLCDDLERIAAIGQQIAELSAESKRLRKSVGCSYLSMAKLHDGETAVVYLADSRRLAFVRPVKDSDDFTVTLGDVTIAEREKGGRDG